MRISDGGADAGVVAEFERSRRELLGRGLAVGGAVLAASSIPLLLSVRNAFAAAQDDGEVLRSAIALEQVAVLAYDTAIASKRLDPTFLRVATRLRDHERQHAAALTAALRELGGSPPRKPSGIADVDRVVKGLRDVKTQSDIATFAIELESAAVSAYYEAHQKLTLAKLLQTAASIMADEGQHLVVLRQAIGRDPVPSAFVTGRS